MKISIFTPYDKNLSFFRLYAVQPSWQECRKGKGEFGTARLETSSSTYGELRLRLPVSLVLKPSQGGMDFVNLAKDIISAAREPCSPYSTCSGMRHPRGIASSAEVKTPAHRLEMAETMETLS